MSCPVLQRSKARARPPACCGWPSCRQTHAALPDTSCHMQAGTVAQHRLLDRAGEFPSVAPAVVGRPHTHAYMVASRFPGADAWGAPQVRWLAERLGLRTGAGVPMAACSGCGGEARSMC